MTYISEHLIQLWTCLICGWMGPEEHLTKTSNHEPEQTEIVCPECLSREDHC